MPSASPAEVRQPPPPPALAKALPKLVPRRRNDVDAASNNTSPQTPPLSMPPNLTNHVFQVPVRRILSVQDHELLLKSESYSLIVAFVFALSDSVRDVTIRSVTQAKDAYNPAIVALLDILDDADRVLQSCPRVETASRFGNPAFRDFLASIGGKIGEWHKSLGIVKQEEVGEISAYLLQAFGNGSRIDYGSGHELNFILWLLCLRQMSFFKDDLFPQIVLLVFSRYLRLMRDIQTTYYLEPAGSHGVWGLDDYQFLPFLFGASQLVGHKHIRPMSIHNELIIDECSQDFLYLDQIRWVNSTKTVQGLRWHSPLLDDISAAKSWMKVEGGMRKMFLAEVLGKLPVAQHFLFGSLIAADEGMSKEGAVAEEQHGHHHPHKASSWGDCCGIKVPSAIGARQEESRHGVTGSLRRIPFD